MAKKTTIIDSNQAQYTSAEFAKFNTELFSDGVMNTRGTNDDLKVVQHGAGDMTVDVNSGACVIDYWKNSIYWKIIAESNATDNISIPSNGGGTQRVDAIIVRISQDEPNSLKNNIMTIERINGTGATPLADIDITTAVGDLNWQRLADIVVNPGDTQILTNQILDTRDVIEFGKNIGGYKTRFIGDGSLLEGLLNSPVNEDILPDADSTRSVGAPANRFLNGYFDFLFGDASGLTNVPKGDIEYPVVFGEDLGLKDLVMLADGNEPIEVLTVTTNTTTNVSIYGVNWQGQSILPRRGGFIRGARVHLLKQGTPVFNMTFALRATDINGLPTGPDLASVTYDTTTLPNGATFDFVFTTPYQMTVGQKYAIIAYGDGGSAANYMRWSTANNDTVYADGTGMSSNTSGATWSSPANDRYLVINMEYGDYQAGKVYKARSDNKNLVDKTIGFTTQSGLKGQTKNIMLLRGIVTGLSGLVAGERYYVPTLQTVSDLSGGTSSGSTYYIGQTSNGEQHYMFAFEITERCKLLEYTTTVYRGGAPTGNLIATLYGGTNPGQHDGSNADMTGGGYTIGTPVSVNYLNIPGGTPITFTFGTGIVLDPGKYYVRLVHDTPSLNNNFQVRGTGAYTDSRFSSFYTNPNSTANVFAANAVDFILNMEDTADWNGIFGTLTREAYNVKRLIGTALSATELLMVDTSITPKRMEMKTFQVNNTSSYRAQKIACSFRPSRIMVFFTGLTGTSNITNESYGQADDFQNVCHYKGNYTADYSGQSNVYCCYGRWGSQASYAYINIKNDGFEVVKPNNDTSVLGMATAFVYE